MSIYKGKKAQDLGLNLTIAAIFAVIVSILVLILFTTYFSKSGNDIDMATAQFEQMKDLDSKSRNYQFSEDIRAGFYYDKGQKQLYYADSQGVKQKVESDFDEKRVRVYSKEEVTDKYFSLEKVSYLSNHIRTFRNLEDASSFITSTDRAMDKIEITKNVNYDEEKKETSVKYFLINHGDLREGYSLYYIVPKETAKDVNSIRVRNAGNSYYYVVEKDPVIGMHFNDSENRSVVEFILPGSSSGGDIIVTYEPVVFNGPEIIVRYRPEVCHRDEAHLFDIENFEGSEVYPASDSKGNFKVCLSHSKYFLRESDNNYSKILFNMQDGNRISLSDERSEDSIGVEVLNKTNVRWNVFIGENRPGESYTCIGSISSRTDGLFGDCQYSQERIWIALEELDKQETFAQKFSISEAYPIILLFIIILIFSFFLIIAYYFDKKNRKTS